MAKHTDMSWVDVGARLQIGDGGFGVRGEIGRGRGRIIAGRGANAAFVVTQDGNAMAVEIVGQDQKEFMTHQLFVAGIGARSGNQHYRRKRPSVGRLAERAFQHHAGHGGIGEPDVLVAIGQGTFGDGGFLRTLRWRRVRGRVCHTPEDERRGQALVPRPDPALRPGVPHPRVAGADLWDGEA